jgi:hypothetical protein
LAYEQLFQRKAPTFPVDVLNKTWILFNLSSNWKRIDVRSNCNAMRFAAFPTTKYNQQSSLSKFK